MYVCMYVCIMCFQNNYLGTNSEKFKVTLKTDDKLKIYAGGSFIFNKTTVKLFGMTADNNFF